jgi:hypothetical protein
MITLHIFMFSFPLILTSLWPKHKLVLLYKLTKLHKVNIVQILHEWQKLFSHHEVKVIYFLRGQAKHDIRRLVNMGTLALKGEVFWTDLQSTMTEHLLAVRTFWGLVEVQFVFETWLLSYFWIGLLVFLDYVKRHFLIHDFEVIWTISSLDDFHLIDILVMISEKQELAFFYKFLVSIRIVMVYHWGL